MGEKEITEKIIENKYFMFDYSTPEKRKEYEENFVYLDKFLFILENLKKQIIDKLDIFEEQYIDLNPSLEGFKNAITFKMARLLDIYLELEKFILSSSLDRWKSLTFETHNAQEESIRKVTNLTDLILTQFFSLFDIFIKKICSMEKIKISNDVDSIYKLKIYLKNTKDHSLGRIFWKFEECVELFENLKIYRNYLIHHGNLTLTRSGEKINKEYTVFYYFMQEITEKEKRKYEMSDISSIKINSIIRMNLFKQFEVFNETLDFIILMKL